MMGMDNIPMEGVAKSVEDCLTEPERIRFVHIEKPLSDLSFLHRLTNLEGLSLLQVTCDTLPADLPRLYRTLYRNGGCLFGRRQAVAPSLQS